MPADLHHISDTKPTSRHIIESPTKPTLKEPAPANPVQVRKPAQQNHKIMKRMNVSCFKPLTFGYFVCKKWNNIVQRWIQINITSLLPTATLLHQQLHLCHPQYAWRTSLYNVLLWTYAFKKYMWNFASHPECSYMC